MLTLHMFMLEFIGGGSLQYLGEPAFLGVSPSVVVIFLEEVIFSPILLKPAERSIAPYTLCKTNDYFGK